MKSFRLDQSELWGEKLKVTIENKMTRRSEAMLEGCTTTLGVHGTTKPMRSSPQATKYWMGELKATADRGSPRRRRMRKTSTENEDLAEDSSTEAEARGNPSEPSRVKPGSTSRLARCSLPEKDQPATKTEMPPTEGKQSGGGVFCLWNPRTSVRVEEQQQQQRVRRAALKVLGLTARIARLKLGQCVGPNGSELEFEQAANELRMGPRLKPVFSMSGSGRGMKDVLKQAERSWAHGHLR
ncbi:unnamed protein product [Linum tenue]|uniref:Uncharacterized protein n=1 Tax=Linum tenue TaxID=586396 RepID=A0AAV0L4Y3_9ROSI|nr:unnamed protein product [Linum tenue]